MLLTTTKQQQPLHHRQIGQPQLAGMPIYFHQGQSCNLHTTAASLERKLCSWFLPSFWPQYVLNQVTCDPDLLRDNSWHGLKVKSQELWLDLGQCSWSNLNLEQKWSKVN